MTTILFQHTLSVKSQILPSRRLIADHAYSNSEQRTPLIPFIAPEKVFKLKYDFFHFNLRLISSQQFSDSETLAEAAFNSFTSDSIYLTFGLPSAKLQIVASD